MDGLKPDQGGGNTLQKLRFCIFCDPVSNMSVYVGLDEIYLYATRQIITGVEEQEPTQRTPELSDIILNPSNLYQENFQGRVTLTIYEANTGRMVQAPIQVYGHVDVDFSGFPAGVYFGVYEPQEGRQQVGKIIKTQ